jgi:hypothetical protein
MTSVSWVPRVRFGTVLQLYLDITALVRSSSHVEDFLESGNVAGAAPAMRGIGCCGRCWFRRRGPERPCHSQFRALSCPSLSETSFEWMTSVIGLQASCWRTRPKPV